MKGFGLGKIRVWFDAKTTLFCASLRFSGFSKVGWGYA